MYKRYFWGLIFILIFISSLSFGKTIKVIDSLKREVKISLPVHRIVALNSDALEVLRILNAQDMVVGVFSGIVREKRFWGDLAKRPKVGKWNKPNIEAIVTLKPDIVIAYTRSPGIELERKLSAFHIPVLRLDFYKVKTLINEVNILAQVLNKKQAAMEFCNWYTKYIKQFSKIKNIKKRPLVYIESYTEYHSVGPGSGGHEICELAGGKNIAGDFSIPYPRVTPEWVVTQDPDIIVKAAAWGRGYELNYPIFLNKLRKRIINRPGWRHIKAVKTERVYVIDSSIWSGPRAIIGIAYLAKWFHPKIFTKLNPESLHKEYLEKFQHIPFKGVYVSQK